MRLIDTDALVTIFSECGRKHWIEHSYVKAREAGAAQVFVREAPTIDAALVRHGKWQRMDDSCCICSQCRASIALCDACKEWTPPKFCPYCGVCMDTKEVTTNDITSD